MKILILGGTRFVGRAIAESALTRRHEVTLFNRGSDPHAYGGRKVLCEQVLRERAGVALTVMRPTVVIGPHDYTDRFPWWVRAIARGRTPAGAVSPRAAGAAH